jgi:beta-N-acetylhexosaminidase
MAIGAAWDLDLANQVGQVMGSELSTLGFNLYLGPNLDVLESENNEAAEYLGVNTFGGDPFWVGEMGKAFINGVHTGSEDRMIVVAQNFPGTGYSDRSPEDEVATVRKSLEQLKQIELAPYFTVTSPGLNDPSRVDAMMVSHIRYQGFQGNIRATTKPISFDSNAFQQIMSLSQFATWRENGGLMISDNLGSGAVRRFFDPNNENFDATRVARSAFLAGNDMLYVDDFVATSDPDAYSTIRNTLDFFVQKYREDSAFAQRVDSSVKRILDVKLGIYEDLSYESVTSAQLALDALGKSSEVTFNVAQNAITLISPSAQELDTLLPSPPQSYEDIIVFSDVRTVRQCDECPPLNTIRTNSLANALINLYGPQASGQIRQDNLYSYTFSQLVEYMDNVENGSGEYLSANLNSSEWVIFNTLDVDPDYPDSNALRRVLTERPDLLSGKHVIVFALDSPIYLDATDISKVTAYYALYSKAPEFINVAARILMQEIESPGALPVSLNAVGYDLISMTAPDPNQIIGLNLVLPKEESEEGGEGEEITQETPSVTLTPELTPMPSFTVGDTITIRTDSIYDHNHNIVPDGTIVRFNFRIIGEPEITQQFETTTTAGIASFNYRIEAAGGLEVNATSEPASQSETLQINIEPDGSAEVVAISPTPLFSPTPTEGPTPTSTQDFSPTSTPTLNHGSYPTLGEWALGVIVMAVGSGLAFLIGQLWWGSLLWGLRSALCTLIGGLLTYTYLNIGFSGTRYWMEKSGTIFVAEMVVVGLLIGWIAALVWWMRTDGRYPLRRK